MTPATTGYRPSIAVFKFASCDGCQLSLLDLEDELLTLAGAVRIAHFAEMSRARSQGPYDIALVEGSITTSADAERLSKVRDATTTLITIGACATAGGIQALRNFAEAQEYAAAVYPSPEFIQTLETSTSIAEHVLVDYELRGCPVNRHQLLEVIAAALAGRRPVIATHSVCQECKQRGAACVLVSRGLACLGPVTQAGCGALCPAVGRGCYGCFGPSEGVNTESLAGRLSQIGVSEPDLTRWFRTFNAGAPAFLKEGIRHDPQRQR